MTVLLDGKSVAAALRQRLTTEVSQAKLATGRVPGLAVVLVGADPASEIYVRQKGKAARAAGMQSWEQRLPYDSTTDEVLAVVDELNHDDEVHGILVQLPLPPHVDRQRVIERISPPKDVDGLTRYSQGALMQNLDGLRPCTPRGIMDLLAAYDVEVSGKHAVVIGRSALVGLPVSLMLMQKNATVTVIHSRTTHPAEIARTADIVIAAAGQPHLVTREWVKPGAVVVDVGIHRTEAGLIGDVALADLEGYAGAVSPVPGGVGPMTIAELLNNTWQAFSFEAGGV